MIGHPSEQDGAILPTRDTGFVPHVCRSCFGVFLPYNKNPLLTKLARSRWLDIGLVLFLRVYRPRRNNHAKKELGQNRAILTEQAWSITHMYSSLPANASFKNTSDGPLYFLLLVSHSSKTKNINPILFTLGE